MPKGPYKVSAITKETLLDAAFEVFSSKGYSTTRLEDIAIAAGHTRGAISFHFKNKSTICRAIIEQRLGTGRETADEHYRADQSVIKMLESVVDNLVRDRVSSHKATRLYRSLMNERPEGLEDLVEMLENHFKHLIASHIKIIEHGQATGELRADVNPKVQAQNFYATFLGIVDNLYLLFDEYDEEAQKAHLKSTLVHSLRA